MVWNIAGEFVKPKNVTLGSNRPWFVMNAAFHSSPSLMRTLLYVLVDKGPGHLNAFETCAGAFALLGVLELFCKSI